MSEALTEAAGGVLHLQSDLVPPAKHKVTITVRLEPAQHAAWTKAAKAEDRSLEYFIRKTVDEAVRARKRRARRPAGG